VKERRRLSSAYFPRSLLDRLCVETKKGNRGPSGDVFAPVRSGQSAEEKGKKGEFQRCRFSLEPLHHFANEMERLRRGAEMREDVHDVETATREDGRAVN
jgi:hypothetical protein